MCFPLPLAGKSTHNTSQNTSITRPYPPHASARHLVAHPFADAFTLHCTAHHQFVRLIGDQRTATTCGKSEAIGCSCSQNHRSSPKTPRSAKRFAGNPFSATALSRRLEGASTDPRAPATRRECSLWAHPPHTRWVQPDGVSRDSAPSRRRAEVLILGQSRPVRDVRKSTSKPSR